MRATAIRTAVALLTLIGASALIPLTPAAAGDHSEGDHSPGLVEVVGIDECDPATFNAAVGAGFCQNVTLGAAVKLSDLFASVAAGTPNAGWDFAPDEVRIGKNSVLSVANQGGEPHTATEVEHFGGGFLPPLNAPGQTTAPECVGGFSNPSVAATRILQGSHRNITGLSKGTHLFQCCIHPWMRFQVDVK